MFIALDEYNNRIAIENATKGNKYFCPICGEELKIRATESLAVRTHFAHKQGTKCLDDWSHDMSEWHLSWQQRFPIECREVVISKDGVKHRADVCINNTVIEFQHSPITSEEIAKRNEFYQSCGHHVVWVFDAEGKIKNSIGDSIDPIQCRTDDLCWRRAKKEFTTPIPSNVKIYLQYKSHISNDKYANQQFDIMLLLTKVAPKNFIFYQTIPYYILPSNFLKEYGAESNIDVLSISDIIKITEKYIEDFKKNMRKRNSPKRRWHL